jgi:integrase
VGLAVAEKEPDKMALTIKRVAQLLARGTPSKTCDGRGLYLVVVNSGNANWTLRFQLNHRKRWMGLGSALTFTLAEARERAQQARKLLADGIDPLLTKATERAASKRMTFGEAARHWHDVMRPGWSSAKHVANTWDALSKWAIPFIGELDVAAVETADVLRVLQQPLDGRTLWMLHPTTADRLRTSIKLILDWAAVAGHRGSDVPNPARWAGHLAMVLPSPTAVAPVVKQPSLDYRRVPELIAKLAKREDVGAAATRFLIMTAVRINEAANARWSEVDLREAVWVIPAARMKARKEHRVPLAPEVILLIRNLPTEDDNPHLFIGGGRGEALSDSTIRTTLRREGYGDVVAHGFRSSFSDWAHERTAHSSHTIELSLAHSVGNEVEQAYRRGDMIEKRHRLMGDWATYCTSPPVDAKVLNIGKAR